MEELVLVGLDGEVFYKGEDDYAEVAYAVEEYLQSLTHDEIKENYKIDLKEEIERCKNEALTCQDTYTWEEAVNITMDEFDKLGVHHDSFTGRMMEFYYDIFGKFE